MDALKKHLRVDRRSANDCGACKAQCKGPKSNPIEQTRLVTIAEQAPKARHVPNERHLKRQLRAINSMFAIKLKLLLLLNVALLLVVPLCEAGFFTFYFPNMFKPKGFSELTDMIDRLDHQINETKDQFSDARYFWGLVQQLDNHLDDGYPEESACLEVFPMFRQLAIEYAYIDFEHYIKPIEEYKEHLEKFRAKWYPAGLESKAALPREWEQDLLGFELDAKIKWFDLLTNSEKFRDKRSHMIEIWKKVRRNLDYSLPCIYLRYAYRQVAEDISQVALDANLEGMKQAQKVLVAAYKRIEKYKESDKAIISDIMEEIEKEERFTIKA